METRLQDMNRFMRLIVRLAALILLGLSAWFFLKPIEVVRESWPVCTIVIGCLFLAVYQKVEVHVGTAAAFIMLVVGFAIAGFTAVATSHTFTGVMMVVGLATIVAYFVLGGLARILYELGKEYDSAPESSTEELLASQRQARLS